MSRRLSDSQLPVTQFFGPHYTYVCIVYSCRFFMLVNRSRIISSALWLLCSKFTSQPQHSKLSYITVSCLVFVQYTVVNFNLQVFCHMWNN